MTIQKLRYIVEVTSCGSINEAAKRLFISQPSLSSAIKEVEEEAGIQIFLRTNKGVVLSQEGVEFLGYARQVLEQVTLLERRYDSSKPVKQLFSVSTQHYAFVVKAFVNLVKQYGGEVYEFVFRDTRTYEILEDVKTLRSEIGVIYLNDFNGKVLRHILKQEELDFHVLFHARPHVFISAKHPLAQRTAVTLDDLEAFPCLTFEQGETNSFYYAEEILSTLPRSKSIRVSDRATIFNLMIGLNGYTISTGVMNAELNGEGIIAIPLAVDEIITVGWISHKKVPLSIMADRFIQELKKETAGFTAESKETRPVFSDKV